MLLKRNIDFRNCISLFFNYVTCFIISFFFLENDSFLVPSVCIFISITLLFFSLFYSIWYSNSYFYLKHNRSKINPLKDNPIKISDIQGYRLDNPFFMFSGWCFSSKNITIYLKTANPVIFAVKEQKDIVNTLKENKIPEYKNGKIKGKVSNSLIFVISLLISILICFKTKNMKSNNSNIFVLICSFMTSFYWLINLIIGFVIINKQNKN